MGYADALEAETQRVIDSAEQHEARLRERSQEETELRGRLGGILQRQNAVRRRCKGAIQRLQAGRGTGHAQAAGDSGTRDVPAVSGEEVNLHREALVYAMSRTQLSAVLRWRWASVLGPERHPGCPRAWRAWLGQRSSGMEQRWLGRRSSGMNSDGSHAAVQRRRVGRGLAAMPRERGGKPSSRAATGSTTC